MERPLLSTTILLRLQRVLPLVHGGSPHRMGLRQLRRRPPQICITYTRWGYPCSPPTCSVTAINVTAMTAPFEVQALSSPIATSSTIGAKVLLLRAELGTLFKDSYFTLESSGGIVGSVLAKEGSIPTVSDIFSGAFKVFWKQIRHDDSKATPSRPKPRNDSLLQQVNSLRQELQLLASNRSVTIVTSGGSGSRRYGIVVVVIVVGCGYIWWKASWACLLSEVIGWVALASWTGGWASACDISSHVLKISNISILLLLLCLILSLCSQGWKLPDMMFATRRSLSNASSAVTKQLENVYTSIAASFSLSNGNIATKRHLSSRIDRVDCNLDECAELTAATREEVSELRGEVKVTCVDVQSVHHAVRTLETKIHRIEGKQDSTNEGVKKLVYAAWNLENSRAPERIQAQA
ncbi:hypothetical protein C3L33_13338, partial [Rhododendron williamsianum]